jgi:hypothetical protein
MTDNLVENLDKISSSSSLSKDEENDGVFYLDKILMDEENVCFAQNYFDLVISSLK